MMKYPGYILFSLTEIQNNRYYKNALTGQFLIIMNLWRLKMETKSLSKWLLQTVSHFLVEDKGFLRFAKL